VHDHDDSVRPAAGGEEELAVLARVLTVLVPPGRDARRHARANRLATVPESMLASARRPRRKPKRKLVRPSAVSPAKKG
jgi:hypothetical protein